MVRSSLVVSLLAAASTAVAAVAKDEAAQNIVPGAYIFELQEGHDRSDFYKAVAAEGKTKLKLDYKLFQGVSVQLNAGNKSDAVAAKMAAMPAVKQMWPLRAYPMPNPKVEWIGHPDADSSAIKSRADAAAKDTFSPHVMTQVDKMRAKGITGKGLKVAVVDTGIDYTHPALGNNCFGPGCLVGFGTDLVGDAYTGFNTPHPDDDPMDCAGHGSHVAGIVAAQPNEYGFTGAAPGVTLGAYRVFGCKGSAGDDVLIAAFNQAYEDGADIITASIGGPSGWTEDPWSVAVSRIVDRGVPCTVSAGNEGAEGLFYASTAAQGKGVIGVASVDNVITPSLLYVSYSSTDGGEETKFGYNPGEPSAWDDVKLSLYSASLDSTAAADGCEDFPADTPDLSDKIVLIRRGTCTFVQKATFAAAKGAKYVMIYNNVAGAISIDVSTVPEIKASGMVDNVTGNKWIADLKAGKDIVLTMTGPANAKSYAVEVANTLTPAALSLFTTWGPTWEMDLKPQVSAPGGTILSTYPLALGGYAVLSGTSMACPITAGVVALIGQARGTLDPRLISSLLSANANPQLFNDGQQFYDFLAPVAQQGGGLIQAFDAAYSTSIMEPSGLSFNDTDNFIPEMNFTISNKGSKAITYSLSNVPAISVYTLDGESPQPEAFPNDLVQTAAKVQLSETKFTLNAGERRLVGITPTPPKDLDPKRLGLWSGYIAVNASDGTSLSLPYQGLVGSLHKATVLPSDGGAYISDTHDAVNSMYPPVAANHTFTLPAPGTATADSLLPVLAMQLTLGSSFIRADIVPLTTCPPKRTKKFWGVSTIGQPAGFPLQYQTRGLTPAPWDGRLDDGTFAPPGKYKFVVRALHIFGDEKKKKDFDVSESPAFRIEYA